MDTSLKILYMTQMDNLHLSEEFFGFLAQADMNTSAVTLGFSHIAIHAEESRQAVCADSYGNGENQVSSKPNPA